MELPQLCEVMARRMCAQDVDETIRRAFRAFDPSHKGFVSRRDLLQVMSRVAPHLSERTTELIFSQVSHPSADHPTRPLPLRSRVEPRACCERLLRRSAGGENPLTLSTRGAGPACPRSPSARLPRCYCPLTGRRRFGRQGELQGLPQDDERQRKESRAGRTRIREGTSFLTEYSPSSKPSDMASPTWTSAASRGSETS